VSGTCGSITSNVATLGVNVLPVIATQPVSQAICQGNSVTFSVTASNALSYQWRKGTSNIPGATGSSYTIPSVSAADAGNYRVVVNSLCNSRTSNIATLTVNTLPTISAQPVSSTICEGSNVTLSVTASNVTGYQWKKNGNDIPGANNSAMTLNNVNAGDAANYSVAVINGCGNIMSGNALLSVTPGPAITAQPQNQQVCAGNSVTFSVNATQATGYQWNRNGVDIPGANGSSYTINSVTAANAGNYGVTVSGACFNVNSGAATLTVIPAPGISTQPISRTVCTGNSVTFSVTASNATGYQWRKDGNNISGANSSSLTIGSVTTGDAGNYSVVVIGNCTNTTSNNAALIVDPATTGGTVSGSTTVCSGSNSGTLNLSGNSGNVIRWESSTNSGVTWSTISNTTTAHTYNNLTQTTQFRALINGCTSVYSGIATIAVNSSTVGGTLIGNATVCSGSNSGILTLSGQAGTIIRWQRSINGGVSWTNINNTTTTLAYTNLTQTTRYRVVMGGCATINSTVAIITVSPASVGGSVSGTTTHCSTINSGTLTLSGHTGSVVRWEFSTNNGSTWNTIINTTTTQAYINLTQTRRYRAVVKSGECAAINSSVAIITVNNSSNGGTMNGSTTHCTNLNQGNITLSGYTGNIIHWDYSTNGGITWNVLLNSLGNIYAGTNYNYTNLGQTTWYRAKINGGCGDVFSTIAIVTIGCNTLNSASTLIDPHGISLQTTQVSILDVSVMPNPSSNYFLLKIESSSNEKAEVRIFDLAGQILEKFTAVPGESRRFGERLRQGAYIVEVRQGNKQKTHRIIKL